MQFAEIQKLKENLTDNQLFIHLNYSENYKFQQQNKTQSAYFGSKSFSLFTAYTYYRTSDGNLEKNQFTVAS